MEEWKAIDGTNGMIEVSNYGNVRSLLRGTPRLLKTQKDNKGYRRLRVTINRERMAFKVHREVAKAFIPNPDNLPQVNHISGNKDDNSVNNLEWISNVDNAHHAIQNGLWDNVIKASREENEKRRIPIIAINVNNPTDVIKFESISAAEKHFNSRHIIAVLKGQRQTCKGYTFKKEVMP